MEQPELFEAKYTFSQDCDTWQTEGDSQTIEVDIIGVGDNDKYFIIKTDRWSFDTPDELFNMLKKLMIKFEEAGGKIGNTTQS